MYFIKKNNEEKKNNLVDDFQNFFMDSFFSNKALKTDIIETENSYVLKVDLPGVDKKAVTLDFNNQYLTLSVNQEEDKEEKEQHFIRKERSRFSYSPLNPGRPARSFPHPASPRQRPPAISPLPTPGRPHRHRPAVLL